MQNMVLFYKISIPKKNEKKRIKEGDNNEYTNNNLQTNTKNNK